MDVFGTGVPNIAFSLKQIASSGLPNLKRISVGTPKFQKLFGRTDGLCCDSGNTMS